MLKFLYRFLIELTNHLYVSKLIQVYTTSKISRHLISSYSKAFQIDESEAEKNRKEFASLQDFFIRQLKQGARSIDPVPTSVISPVDGFVEDIGTINAQEIITVKDQPYSIQEMFGNNHHYIKYENGIYIILYLSPSDYHRIHSPVTGRILSQWELGRKSYPVNKWGLKYGKSPLAKNYRLLSEMQFGEKHLTLAKVGALFVNSITLTHKEDQLSKGDEIGYFSFGSTVVLLFEKDSFQPLQGLKGNEIKMGQAIGYQLDTF